MSLQNPADDMPERLSKELKALKEKELLEFIRHTVSQLDALGDRLEDYSKEIHPPEVGFDTQTEITPNG